MFGYRDKVRESERERARIPYPPASLPPPLIFLPPSLPPRQTPSSSFPPLHPSPLFSLTLLSPLHLYLSHALLFLSPSLTPSFYPSFTLAHSQLIILPTTQLILLIVYVPSHPSLTLLNFHALPSLAPHLSPSLHLSFLSRLNEKYRDVRCERYSGGIKYKTVGYKVESFFSFPQPDLIASY